MIRYNLAWNISCYTFYITVSREGEMIWDGLTDNGTIRKIIGKWAPPGENQTEVYIQNVSRLTGIAPDEPIGIPSDQPARRIMLGLAMAIQENAPDSIDHFALLRGWTLSRQDH